PGDTGRGQLRTLPGACGVAALADAAQAGTDAGGAAATRPDRQPAPGADVGLPVLACGGAAPSKTVCRCGGSVVERAGGAGRIAATPGRARAGLAACPDDPSGDDQARR